MKKISAINKSNILIAEFMGYHKDAYNLWNNGTVRKPIREFHYNASWNELMEVIDKIEKIDETDIRYGTIVVVSTTYARVGEIEVDLKLVKLTKLQAIYKAIVTFIEKYNNRPY